MYRPPPLVFAILTVTLHAAYTNRTEYHILKGLLCVFIFSGTTSPRHVPTALRCFTIIFRIVSPKYSSHCIVHDFRETRRNAVSQQQQALRVVRVRVARSIGLSSFVTGSFSAAGVVPVSRCWPNNGHKEADGRRRATGNDDGKYTTRPYILPAGSHYVRICTSARSPTRGMRTHITILYYYYYCTRTSYINGLRSGRVVISHNNNIYIHIHI